MQSCSQCGAALEEGDGSRACPRCGTVTPGMGNAAPQSAVAPAAGPPPAVKALIAAGMAVLGIGFAVLFFARVQPPEETVTPSRRPDRDAAGRPGAAKSPGPRGAPLQTYLGALCFADANGDDTPDPILWLDGDPRGRVVAVDGRTGEGLWSSQSFNRPDALGCGGRDTILAGAEEDTSLHALNARTGQERWTAKLSAVPDEIVTGDGCVTVLLKDGTSAGLKLTGEHDPCTSAPRPEGFAGTFWERKRNPQLLRIGDVDVTLTANATGTPALTAQGQRGDAAIWTQELPARAPITTGRPDLFFVASGGSAIAIGVDTAGGKDPRIVALDPASGAMRYERSASYLGSRIATAKASGPYIYVISDAALRAVDPATGDAVWRATTPPKSP